MNLPQTNRGCIDTNFATAISNQGIYLWQTQLAQSQLTRGINNTLRSGLGSQYSLGAQYPFRGDLMAEAHFDQCRAMKDEFLNKYLSLRTKPAKSYLQRHYND